MSAIRLPYFSYPKIKETEANFHLWKCSVCFDTDPTSNGGTVAHGASDNGVDGRKHPSHRSCVLDWHGRSIVCPNCRIDTDVSPLIPLVEKCSIAGQRFYNSLPPIFAQCRNFALNPVNQVYAGVGCMVVGLISQKYPLVSLGLGLQARAIHESIRYGSSHIAIARQIADLTEELISDLGKDYYIHGKLGWLKSAALGYPQYFALISKWVDSDDRNELLHGLKNVQEFAKAAVFGDRIVRFWRAAAAIGSLYCAGKSVCNFKGKRETLTRLSNQNDSADSFRGMNWLLFAFIHAGLRTNN